MSFDLTDHSHARFSPLTDSWVLVSPHRAKRPWLGQQEKPGRNDAPEHDDKCFLCPGNTRATGEGNPDYKSTYIFQNDYAAVKLEQPDLEPNSLDSDPLKERLFKIKGVKGNCFVICFSPQHNLSLPQMAKDTITNVVRAWSDLFQKLEKETIEEGKPYKYLQIFENKGTAMGCSNLHPHGQAWCLDSVPSEPAKEFENFAKYEHEHGTHLLEDIVTLELREKERIVCQNDSFLVIVPYWAVWPFETMVVSKRRIPSLNQFNEEERIDLAEIIRNLTIRYDNLFQTSFPYSMGIHQAPLNADEEELSAAWFHMHFYPPLLRSATVRKFLVGFELLGEPQRDLTPEQAADRLENQDGEVHYLSNIE
ncbi:unnamed protein product [Kluyveromyces dobzhanskii CBS 2104]|uniref:Galactose-1-phosphate uridylyltransferase n=1 Tax=Kluyveromyces dobzhanskii CBS 2104 TaxID=1427455 RepID=A0A0A8LC82_9SACH|nr:unnamed protein product [Kluyveromyces dobzhanskii CBS 2104]